MTKQIRLQSEKVKGFQMGSGTRSYATEDALLKGLARLGFADHRYVVVRTVEGKWTAIFPISNITGPQGGGYLGLYSQHGFMTIG